MNWEDRRERKDRIEKMHEILTGSKYTNINCTNFLLPKLEENFVRGKNSLLFEVWNWL